MFIMDYLMDFFIYVRNCYQFFLADLPTCLGTKLHPGGEFFEPCPFLILNQDLYNEGSNFILSPLEVGHELLKHSHFWQITKNHRFWLFTTISE